MYNSGGKLSKTIIVREKKENNPKKPHKRKRPKKPIRKIKYNSGGKYAKNGVPNMHNSETQKTNMR